MDHIDVLLAAVVVLVVGFTAGVMVGEHYTKKDFVEECAKDNVYLDRKLLVACNVMHAK